MIKSGIVIDIDNRIKTVKDLLNRGLISIEDSMKLLGFSDVNNYMLSQDEIDELVAEMLENEQEKEEQLLLFGVDPSSYKDFKELSKKKIMCNPHVWKNYTGLNESYEYCEKCDEKKK